MSPYSRAITETLHELFDGSVRSFCGVNIRVHFASGYDAQKLSDMSHDFLSGECCVAVSGDDSAVAWGPLSEHFAGYSFGEGDQSQFDHTQDQGPQKAAKRWMEVLGVPYWFIQMVYECCSRSYSVYHKRLVVKGEAGVQMPTGITMTTVLNSMSTLIMYLYYIKHRESFNIEEAARRLGFTLKYFPHSSFGHVTFLKGWWRRDIFGANIWMPLPSASLKIGKLLRDPETIAPRKVGAQRAVELVAFALASSYGNIPNDYPIFGPFLQVMLRCGHNNEILRGHALLESWKPRVGTFICDREDSLEAIEYRYNISRAEVDDLERLLKTVVTLPAYVEHVVFDKLCDVDY
jgi:hypothetical protein